MSKPDLTTYGGRLRDLGYAGEIVDQNVSVMETKINEAAQVIDFGFAVARGTADNTCKANDDDDDAVIGISVAHRIKASAADGTVTYAKDEALPVLRSGYVYAITDEDVVRGAGVISLTAKFGKLAGTTGGAAGEGRVAVPGAKWETTTAAGKLGIVKILN